MIMRLIAWIVSFCVGVVLVILGLRVLLRFFDANADNGFVHFIYHASDVLLGPFGHIFSPGTIGQTHLVDFTALFALGVYAVAGAIVTSLLRAGSRRN